MPQGRHTALTVSLTTQERQTLQAWQRMSTIPAGHARRARILLLLAAGHTITETVKRVGMSRQFAYKWVARFQAQGIAGLLDQPRTRFVNRVTEDR